MALREVVAALKSLEAFDTVAITREIEALTPDELGILSRAPDDFRPCLERLRGRLDSNGKPVDAAEGQPMNLRQYLNSRFANKGEIVKLVLACTVAQVPMVLLGPPGTAKSAIIRTLCDQLGLRPGNSNLSDFDADVQAALDRHALDLAAKVSSKEGRELKQKLRMGNRELFEYLVTRFTTPEEILGPVKIDAMLDLSIFYRESEGTLPNASIAFLDEIFKANSAILNALLSIINERIYYNAGRAFNVNLMMLFGASNESPDALELGALFDRFPIRVISDRVKDDQVDSLLIKATQDEYDRGVRPRIRSKPADAPPAEGGTESSEPKPEPAEVKPKKIACVNDFRLLARLLYCMDDGPGIFAPLKRKDVPDGFSFPHSFRNAFVTLREQFSISDRTPERLLRVAKAFRMLDGAARLRPDDLGVFRYCFQNMDQASVLREIVDELIKNADE